jgi:hypothetical protein
MVVVGFVSMAEIPFPLGLFMCRATFGLKESHGWAFKGSRRRLHFPACKERQNGPHAGLFAFLRVKIEFSFSRIQV